MKHARERELLRYFRWLAENLVEQFPDRLLGRLLLYALHADSELDAQQIFRSLEGNPNLEKRAMSVAEKLKTEGRMEGISQGISRGREEGFWIGRIQTLEEFLQKSPTPREALEGMTLAELEAFHHDLHRQYEIRFKRG